MYTLAGVEDIGLRGSHSIPGGTATCSHGNETIITVYYIIGMPRECR